MLYGYWSRRYAQLALLLGLILIFYGCGDDAQSKKATHMQRGEAYVTTEKYAEAIIEFSNAVKLGPKDAQAHYKLALAYLKQGGMPQMQAAFQALQKSVMLDPSLTDAQLKVGEFYVLDRKYDEAQAQAMLVLQHEPNHVQAHMLSGNAYAGKQNLQRAIERLPSSAASRL